MKNVICTLILASVLCLASFILGGISATYADGWIDEETQEFVIDWMGQEWAWDISEG